MTESKGKINWRVDMSFYMVNMQYEKEREGKKKEKK
jgi:hypothetical protein